MSLDHPDRPPRVTVLNYVQPTRGDLRSLLLPAPVLASPLWAPHCPLLALGPLCTGAQGLTLYVGCLHASRPHTYP